ncbi:M15 family metallopeptidase [Leifsonia sp. NPDC102414]|uniref:M15 family metallopeptidase n=1 Tax=Leifsonia sp. NPDC102414 TaxID=3364124 RepID=UPI0038301957
MNRRTIITTLAAVALAATIAGCTSAGPGTAAGLGSVPPVTNPSELGPDDGYIPVGETVALTDDVPAVTKLDPQLRDALDRAAEDAADRDVAFTLTDGWRSERYQQYLFDQAVTKYGSEEEASKWVKSGDQSKHLRGDAVDIATADAMDWLSRFGAEYGLCQVYANEAWHFELLGDGSGECPAQLTDGTAG